jgi:hypothetical protein
VHPAAAEPGGLARRVQAWHWCSAGAKDPRGQVGVQPAERLAGQHVQPDGDQRAGRGVEQPVRPGHPHEPVAYVGACSAHRDKLAVLAEPIHGFPVARHRLGLDDGGVEARLSPGDLVHPVDQAAQTAPGHEVFATIDERLHRAGDLAAQPAGQHRAPVPSREVGVLLRA